MGAINSVTINNLLRILAGLLVIVNVGLEYAKANGAALGLNDAQISLMGLLSVMVVAAVALLPRLQGDGFDPTRHALDAGHVTTPHAAASRRRASDH